MNRALLEMNALSVGYDDVAVLENVSLSLKAGDMLAVLGANGAGKSTLVQTLARILPKIKGSIVFDGELVGLPEHHARDIAYLEQAATAHWPMRVYDVVALGRLPHRNYFTRLTDDDHAVIHQTLVETDSLHLKDRDISCLSGGERARVLLARALAVQPKLLLVDEPVGGLDPAHQIAVMELLQQKAKAGMTVICVLHDLSLAARFCSKSLLLHDRKILASGATEKVLTDAHLKTAFHIEVLSGTHDGKPYLLPWSVLS